jgi:hypothetical protein
MTGTEIPCQLVIHSLAVIQQELRNVHVSSDDRTHGMKQAIIRVEAKASRLIRRPDTSGRSEKAHRATDVGVLLGADGRGTVILEFFAVPLTTYPPQL